MLVLDTAQHGINVDCSLVTAKAHLICRPRGNDYCSRQARNYLSPRLRERLIWPEKDARINLEFNLQGVWQKIKSCAVGESYTYITLHKQQRGSRNHSSFFPREDFQITSYHMCTCKWDRNVSLAGFCKGKKSMLVDELLPCTSNSTCPLEANLSLSKEIRVRKNKHNISNVHKRTVYIYILYILYIVTYISLHR